MTQAYVKALSAAADQADAVGYAFAVNGKVRSIDVYASHDLFARLWPKMLGATAVEAVADLQKGKTFDPARLEAVKSCIDDAQRGALSEKKVTARVTMLTRETDGNLVYETRDQAVAAPPPVAGAGVAASGDWIHRNYLSKDEETKAALRPRENRMRDQLEPRQHPANQQNNAPTNP